VRRKALPHLACCLGSSEYTRFGCTPFSLRLPSQYFVLAPDMTLTSAPRVDLPLQRQATSAAADAHITLVFLQRSATSWFVVQSRNADGGKELAPFNLRFPIGARLVNPEKSTCVLSICPSVEHSYSQLCADWALTSFRIEDT